MTRKSLLNPALLPRLFDSQRLENKLVELCTWLVRLVILLSPSDPLRHKTVRQQLLGELHNRLTSWRTSQTSVEQLRAQDSQPSGLVLATCSTSPLTQKLSCIPSTPATQRNLPCNHPELNDYKAYPISLHRPSEPVGSSVLTQEVTLLSRTWFDLAICSMVRAVPTRP